MGRSPRIRLLSPSDIIPHEGVEVPRVEGLVKDIGRRGVLLKPIIVDAETGLLVDGHHRLEALKRLGARVVPAVLIDYVVDVRRVVVRRPEALGLNGSREPVFEGDELLQLRDFLVSMPGLLPPRTTYHITWAKGVRAPRRLSDLR